MSQQSIAGGLFQTVTRLCITVGMGISAAIFDGISKSPSPGGLHAGDPIEPYAGTFWFSTACCAASLLFVPFLTITTQGHDSKETEEKILTTSEAAEKNTGLSEQVGDGEIYQQKEVKI